MFLQELIHPSVSPGAPTVLIFSPRESARLDYVCEFIFHRVLGLNYRISSGLADVSTGDQPCINYSEQKLPGAVQILPQGLLFETGLRSEFPTAHWEQGRFYMFRATGSTADIFSAVFWSISRYEEWQNAERDRHGRFEAAQSFFFRHKAHLAPVTDQWIMDLKALLLTHYPGLDVPPIKNQVISTLDVDNLYAYRHKGWLRTLGASARDLVTGQFANLGRRLSTLIGASRDPFDIYSSLSSFCSEQKLPLFCFFLFRNDTAFDRTVDPRSGAFDKILALLKDNGAVCGLHPSYFTVNEPTRLSDEVRQFSGSYGEPVTCSRQHYLRFDIRRTPRDLLANGIEADFTMGFASSPGFRAGTAYPFRYYDLEKEQALELVAVPFCAMDGAYFVYEQLSPDEALQSLTALAAEVGRTGGNFVTVFHERTFSDHLYPGFGSLYKKLHLHLKGGS